MDANEQRSDDSWAKLPFAEYFFSLILMVVVFPGGFGLWEVNHGNIIWGAVITAAWGYPYFLLIKFLNSKRIVRLAISLPCTMLFLFATFFV